MHGNFNISLDECKWAMYACIIFKSTKNSNAFNHLH